MTAAEPHLPAPERPPALGIERAEALLQSASLLLARGDQREAVRTLHGELHQELGHPGAAPASPYTSQHDAEERHRELLEELREQRARRGAGRQGWLRRLPQWAAWATVAAVIGGLFLRYGYAVFDRWRWQHQHPDGPWISRYYNKRDFQDYQLTRYDVAIDYNWGKGAPAEAMDRDHWSAKWDTCLVVNSRTRLQLRLNADDVGKLLVDGESKINVKKAGGRNAKVTFTPGVHHLQLEYQEKRRGARIQLRGLDFAGTDKYHFQRPRLEGESVLCDPPAP